MIPTSSPSETLISSLTDWRELPMGSAMKCSVADPVTREEGMLKTVFDLPLAVPSRTRWPRDAYIVMSEKL